MYPHGLHESCHEYGMKSITKWEVPLPRDCPRARGGSRRLRLPSRPKGRGMDPHVACTRSGERTIAWSLSARFVWQSIKKNQCQDQRQQASIGGTEICPMPPLDRLNRYRFRYRTGRLLLLTTYIYFELLLISWWNPIRIWPQSRQRRRHQQLQRNRSRTTLSYPWCTLLQMDFVYTWNLPLYKYLIKGYTSNLYKDFYV